MGIEIILSRSGSSIICISDHEVSVGIGLPIPRDERSDRSVKFLFFSHRNNLLARYIGISPIVSRTYSNARG